MAKIKDPNKYSQNANIHPESALSFFLALLSMSLMLVGIVGLAAEFFRDGGLLKQGLQKLFESTTTLVVGIPLILIIFLGLNHLGAKADGKTSLLGEVPMYAMMCVGLYYLYQFLI